MIIRMGVARLRFRKPHDPGENARTRVRRKTHHQVTHQILRRFYVIECLHPIHFFQQLVHIRRDPDQILPAVHRDHDILRVELHELRSIRQIRSVHILRIADRPEFFHRNIHLSRPEMRQRQIDHIIPDRPVTEHKDVVLRPKQTLLQRFHHPFTRDKTPDPFQFRRRRRRHSDILQSRGVFLAQTHDALLRADQVRPALRARLLTGFPFLITVGTPVDRVRMSAAVGTPALKSHGAALRTPALSGLDLDKTLDLAGRHRRAVEVLLRIRTADLRRIVDRTLHPARLADREKHVDRRLHLSGSGFSRPAHSPADPGPGLRPHLQTRQRNRHR